MFGKEKTLRREAWADVARELKGEHRLGSWGRSDMVIVHSGVWEIVLDTFARSTGNSSIPFTRMRAVYRQKEDFHFSVSEDHTPHFVKNIFNMQDVRVGNTVFDKRFRIQSNRDVVAKALLGNPEIQKLLRRMRTSRMEIRAGGKVFNRLPPEYRILYFETRKYMRQPETLRTMFALFAVTLRQLVKVGCASNQMPEFKLFTD